MKVGCMSGTVADANDVERLLEVGCRERRCGNHVAALASFEAAAMLNNDHPGIRVEIAHELRRLGRLDESERLLAAVLDADPANASALIERGHLLRRLDDRAGAAVSFAAAALIEPCNLALRLELVRERRALGQLDKAEQELDTLTGIEPGSAAAAIERGLIRRQRKDHLGAGLAFAAAAAAVPDDLDVRLEFARELRAAEYLEEAEAVLRAALAVNPRHVEALIERAFLSRRRGDRASALALFLRAVEENPDHVRALVELAHEYGFAAAPTAAAAHLDRALSISPFDFPALMAAAEQALDSGDAERASHFAAKARSRHPEQVSAYLIGARAEGQFDCGAALALLNEARARFGAIAPIAATRVHLLRLHRDRQAAGRVIAEHHDQIGRHADLWSEATALSIAQGDFVAAEQALAAPPAEIDASVEGVFGLRGQLAQARRHYKEAARCYHDALGLGALRPQWRADLAQCHLLLGDVESADAHLRASLEGPGRRADTPSANVSQHHLGQLIDELRLDRDLLGRLRDLRALEPAGQIDALSALVRQNPNYTGPSLLLLVAMRIAGRLEQSTPAPSPMPAIPRRIAQYWHAAAPPDDVAALMASWREANPGHEHRLFDNRTAWEFLLAKVSAEAARAFQRAVDIPQRADIFRLGYLAVEGGLFADADDRCLAPLGAILEVKISGGLPGVAGQPRRQFHCGGSATSGRPSRA